MRNKSKTTVFGTLAFGVFLLFFIPLIQESIFASIGNDIEITGNLNVVPFAPIIVSLVADDPNNVVGYGNGDTLTLTFDKATSRPDATTKSDLDALFFETPTLGDNYIGSWLSSSVLEITILDAAVIVSPADVIASEPSGSSATSETNPGPGGCPKVPPNGGDVAVENSEPSLASSSPLALTVKVCVPITGAIPLASVIVIIKFLSFGEKIPVYPLPIAGEKSNNLFSAIVSATRGVLVSSENLTINLSPTPKPTLLFGSSAT